jgi:hypothetical protein
MRLLFLMTCAMGASVSVSSPIPWCNVTPVMMGAPASRDLTSTTWRRRRCIKPMSAIRVTSPRSSLIVVREVGQAGWDPAYLQRLRVTRGSGAALLAEDKTNSRPSRPDDPNLRPPKSLRSRAQRRRRNLLPDVDRAIKSRSPILLSGKSGSRAVSPATHARPRSAPSPRDIAAAPVLPTRSRRRA